MIRLPFDAKCAPISWMKWVCNSASSRRPRRRILDWHFAHCAHRTLGTSSPPMWMISEGNISHTSSSTVFMKAKVESLPAQYTSLNTPQLEGTSNESPVQPSQG